MISFFEQVRMIIQFVVLGIFMSIMIDVCDLFRTKSKILTSILQLFFWFLISVVICQVVLVISKGFLPLYTFLFFLGGYLIYRFLLRKRFVNILNWIKKKARSSKRRFWAFVLPVELSRKVWGFICKLVKKMIPKKKAKEEATPNEENSAIEALGV